MENKDIILPNYNHSILGTISSILKYYNVETNHKSSEKLDNILNKKKYTNVIFLILDGLGEHILEKTDKDGYFNDHKIDVVTSVYPSTTTAALTTYYSGKPPIETGWIAWSQYFKEYGRALDMFSHNESYYREPLRKPMMDVFKNVVNYEAVYSQIENASPDVSAYELGPAYSQRRGTRTLIGDNIDELILQINDLIKIPDRKFILAYCDNPDGLLHKYGTTSNEVKKFVKHAQEEVQKMVDNFDDDTILIISADHGHKDIKKAYTLLDYPQILECLIMPPSLESRVLTFWVKDDMKEEFTKRFNNEFEDEFWLMTKDDFLIKYHFLGYGNKHKKIDDFIGDFVALSVSDSIIRLETFLAEGKPVKKSTHCGLTKDEMEVPVFVFENIRGKF